MKEKQISKDTGNNLRKSAKKEKWDKFKEKSMDAIVKGGSAIGNNRFLVAIRDAFMLPFALVTGASIPLVLSSLFFSSEAVITAIPGVAGSEGMKWVTYLIGDPLSACFSGIMAGFSIYVAFGLGYFIAKSYGKDAIIAGALGVGIMFMLNPLGGVAEHQEIYWWNNGVKEIIETHDGTSANSYLGSNGLIVVLLAVMLGTWVWVKLTDVKWLTIKMPDSVPPMIAKGMAAIFTSAIILVMFSFINQIWFIIATEANLTTVQNDVEVWDVDGIERTVTIDYIKTISTWYIAVESVLAGPLSAIGGNIGSTILISFLIAFFWFFGIHGTNIMMPVTTILWDLPSLNNIEFWRLWQGRSNDPSAIINDTGDYWTTTIRVYGVDQTGLIPIPVTIMGYIGGTGATLGFLIAIFIFSKNKVYRDLAKLSIGPGIFGINEPVNFGFPIVLNPVFFLPYVGAFTLTFSLGHMYILLHWMRPAVLITPSLPFGINVLFDTGFDWRAMLLSWVNLLISFFIWLPFVWIGPNYEQKVAAKIAEKKEMEKVAKLAAKEKKLEKTETIKK